MKFIAYVILFIGLLYNIYPQQKTSDGSLLKINFNQKTIDTNLTVAYWKSVQNTQRSSSELFEKVFTVGTTTYFVKRTDSESYGSFFPGSYKTVLINSQTKEETNLFSHYYPECGTDIYLSSRTNIMSTTTGMILNNNLSSTTYNLSADQVYNLCDADSGMKIVHVVGKLNSLYLVAVRDDISYNIRYFLEDFNNTWLKPTFSHEVKFYNIHSIFSLAPKKTYNITDSLSIMSFEWINNLLVTKYSDSVITKADSLEIEPQPFWAYKSNKLYYIDDNYLTKKEFDETTNIFGEKEVILRLGNNYGADINEDYFATSYSDTLFIYSLVEDKLVNKIDIGMLRDHLSILIDQPFVYINKLDKITGVEEESSVPNSFELYQNYPNPFNPETLISYKLPVAGHVTLKVYDLLGREVTTLVDEYKQPGKYSYQFSTNNISLSSGVYFYILRAGEFSETKKMILLK